MGSGLTGNLPQPRAFDNPCGAQFRRPACASSEAFDVSRVRDQPIRQDAGAWERGRTSRNWSATALIYPEPTSKGGRGNKDVGQTSPKSGGFSADRLSDARAVLRWSRVRRKAQKQKGWRKPPWFRRGARSKGERNPTIKCGCVQRGTAFSSPRRPAPVAQGGRCFGHRKTGAEARETFPIRKPDWRSSSETKLEFSINRISKPRRSTSRCARAAARAERTLRARLYRRGRRVGCSWTFFLDHLPNATRAFREFAAIVETLKTLGDRRRAAADRFGPGRHACGRMQSHHLDQLDLGGANGFGAGANTTPDRLRGFRLWR